MRSNADYAQFSGMTVKPQQGFPRVDRRLKHGTWFSVYVRDLLMAKPIHPSGYNVFGLENHVAGTCDLPRSYSMLVEVVGRQWRQ